MLADRGEIEAALALALRNCELTERLGDVFSHSMALTSLGLRPARRRRIRRGAGGDRAGRPQLPRGDGDGRGDRGLARRPCEPAACSASDARPRRRSAQAEWAAETARRRGHALAAPSRPADPRRSPRRDRHPGASPRHWRRRPRSPRAPRPRDGPGADPRGARRPQRRLRAPPQSGPAGAVALELGDHQLRVQGGDQVAAAARRRLRASRRPARAGPHRRGGSSPSRSPRGPGLRSPSCSAGCRRR